MKKIVYTILSLGLIIAISVAFFVLLFQANNSNVPKQNQLNIKITNFAIDKQWSYIGGLVMDCSFNLTIENKGVDSYQRCCVSPSGLFLATTKASVIKTAMATIITTTARVTAPISFEVGEPVDAIGELEGEI